MLTEPADARFGFTGLPTRSTSCSRPLMLLETIGPGDFIVFDAIGAYSVAVRNFNGFFPNCNGRRQALNRLCAGG